MSKVLMGMTVWNYWEIAARCLKSIREHTNMRDVSLVLFDNGSDDDETLKWLDNCGEEVVHLGKNTGCCGSIRNMFDFSYQFDNIEFVCPLCPDLLVTDTWLERLLDVMDIKKEYILVAPKDNNDFHVYQKFTIPKEFQPEAYRIGNKGYNAHLFGDDTKLQEYVKKEFYAKRRHPAFITTKSVDLPISLWRKSFVKEMGGFDESYDYALGDIEFMVRVGKASYRIGYCLSSFVYHFSHGGSGLYEGYAKLFRSSLNPYSIERMTMIKGAHGVDVAGFGGLGIRSSEEIEEEEKRLIAL